MAKVQRMRQMHFFLLLLLTTLIHHTLANEAPPKCRNYQQACAIQLAKFPELGKKNGPTTAETVTESEQNDGISTSSSISPGQNANQVQLDGEEGSGEPVDNPQIHFVPMPIGQSFPMYDEFVPTTPVYDYTAEPVERTTQEICTCPEEEACDFENSDRLVSFNHQITASFCKPLDEVFKLKCKGTRTLARIIGTLDMETEDRFTGVNDTLVFCRCESGQWAQVIVEPWLNNAFAFTYKCLQSR